MRYYQALELKPSLTLDAGDLQKRFYAASRKWHPDRFTRASAAEQAEALEMTAVLNDAFRTLRDPAKRAEYFLAQRGLEISKDVPPELLEEVFDLNMALEELRSGDKSARSELEAAHGKFAGMLAETGEALGSLFASHDAASEAERPAVLQQIQATLNRRRYVGNLVREVEKELHVDAAN